MAETAMLQVAGFDGVESRTRLAILPKILEETRAVFPQLRVLPYPIPDSHYPPIELQKETISPVHPLTQKIIEYHHPHKSILLDGNSQFGSVEIIGQIHTIYKEFKDELKVIGLCQEQVLLHLQASKAQTVFVEGLTKDLIPSPNYDSELAEYSFKLLSECYSKDHWAVGFNDFIRAVFKDFTVGANINEQQKLYLGLIGAPFIYAACNPNITLLKTTTPEYETVIPKLQAAHKGDPEFDHYYKFPLREFLALKQVETYLAQNPGSNVHLVFGRQHQFSGQAHNVFGLNAPLITKVGWRLMEGQLGWN